MPVVLEAKADTADAERGVLSLSTALQAGAVAAAALVTAAAAVGTALFKVASDTAQVGDDLHKMALRTGMSAEELSALGHVANLAGQDLMTIEDAVRTGQKAMFEASQGAETFTKAFDGLGVSVTTSDGKLKTMGELLPELATSLQGITNETEKSALMQQAFGDAGTKLLPILKQGGAALNAQMLEAEALGLVYSDVAAQQSAEFVDAQARIKGAVKGLTQAFGKELIPVFTSGMNVMARHMADNRAEAQNLGQAVASAMIPAFSMGAKTATILGAGLDALRVIFALLGAGVTLVAEKFVTLGRIMVQVQTLNGTFGGGEVIAELKDIEDTLGSVSESYGELAVEAMDAMGKVGERLEETDNFTREWKEELARLNEEMVTGADLMGGLAGGLLNVANAAGELADALAPDNFSEFDFDLSAFEDMPALFGDIVTTVDDATESLGEFDAAFSIVGTNGPPTSLLDDIFGVFTTDAAMGMATNAFGALFSGGLEGAADSITSGVSHALSIGLNAVIPGLGVIAAPLMDALGNLFSGLFGGKANAVDHVTEFYSIVISDGLAAAIDQAAASLGGGTGSLDAAFRLLLADAIKEATISSLADLKKWATLVHQTLSSVDEGLISLDQAVESMAASWLALVPAFKATGGSAMELQAQISDLITRGVDLDTLTRMLEPVLVSMFDSGIVGAQELVDWLATMGIEFENLGATATATLDEISFTFSANMQEQRREYRALAREQGVEDQHRTEWIRDHVIAERQRMRREARINERRERMDENKAERQQAKLQRDQLREIFKEPIVQRVVVELDTQSANAVARELQLTKQLG